MFSAVYITTFDYWNLLPEAFGENVCMVLFFLTASTVMIYRKLNKSKI